MGRFARSCARSQYQIWGWINNGVNSTSYGTNFTGTTTTITGLIPVPSHEWGVRAFDGAGNVSGFDYGPIAVNPVPTSAQLVSVGPSSAAGVFQFSVQTGAIQTLLIQATTNPANPASWITIATNPLVSSSFIFTDTDATIYPARFYRVLVH